MEEEVNVRKVVPVGDPPIGKNKVNLERLKVMKAPLLKKTEMACAE